ncbi:MAG: ribosomal protein S18-alanine N-acetyltransferase [Oscillospiraceae bacterium]|nr:ribosomal protein S18-alanine N-acetyltransferase [Oscillospiraceae bacterium]
MVNIIPLREEHIDDICEIENESFGDPWKREFFTELLENPLAVSFAAEENGGTVGYLIAYNIIDEMQILNIAVKKTRRGQKIAAKLFAAAFDFAEANKIREFTLEVRVSNTPAAALYKKLGFKTDGIRKNYYKNPKEDAVLMSLII